jgi:hypothetical protein
MFEHSQLDISARHLGVDLSQGDPKSDPVSIVIAIGAIGRPTII